MGLHFPCIQKLSRERINLSWTKIWQLHNPPTPLSYSKSSDWPASVSSTTFQPFLVAIFRATSQANFLVARHAGYLLASCKDRIIDKVVRMIGACRNRLIPNILVGAQRRHGEMNYTIIQFLTGNSGYRKSLYRVKVGSSPSSPSCDNISSRFPLRLWKRGRVSRRHCSIVTHKN